MVRYAHSFDMAQEDAVVMMVPAPSNLLVCINFGYYSPRNLTVPLLILPKPRAYRAGQEVLPLPFHLSHQGDDNMLQLDHTQR